MASPDNTQNARPILLDFNNTLLKRLLEEETKLWQRINSGVTNLSDYAEPSAKVDFLSENVAETLLRHGKELKNIHSFFQTLIPRRYVLKLSWQIGPDFQVVEHIDKKCKSAVYKGTETVRISYKENHLLHPEEQNIYRCALLAALYPVLSSSEIPSPTAKESAKHNHPQNSDSTQRLTPTSKECMLYEKDPISSSSIFPIDSDDLTELVRVTFCLTQRGHALYKERVERHMHHDPAKGLLEEMRDILLVLQKNCHPFFQPNCFYNRECYSKWLSMETSIIKQIIEEQNDLVQKPVINSSNPPLNFKDKHAWYCKLLVKLYRLESLNSCENVVTKEAIPLKPLSPNASRLLNEFGKRYRIGELYQRIALLEYLARNFETKEWYCKHVGSVLKSVLHTVLNTELGNFILKEEIKMFRQAVVHLRNQIENSLTRINRMFPRNSPEGALQAVLALFAILFEVDQVKVFQDEVVLFSEGSLANYLKKYVKEEMCTNYESHKMQIFAQLNIPAFSQDATPRTINLMILGISEKLRNYRMFYKNDFIKYFNIFELAIDVFYGLLMQDVHELCNTYPVNQQLESIDYRMIALAFKLSAFDKDHLWEGYLSLEKQTWREHFLKHSLSWMHSLHRKLQESVLKALQQDTWQGIVLNEDNNTTLTTSQRSLPQPISSKHVTVGTTSSTTHFSSITPSATSAFVQVASRSSSTVHNSPLLEQVKQDNSTQDAAVLSKTQQDKEDGHTSGNSDHSEPVIITDPSGSEVTSSSKTTSTSGILAHNTHQTPSSVPRSYQTCVSSIDTRSSDEYFADARSYISTIEDERSRDVDTTDAPEITNNRDIRLVPVSSSVIDTICVINRVVTMVCHIAQLLCPEQTATAHDSLRMSPEDRFEVQQKLERGRAKMARELSTMLSSTVSFYGYYVMSVESRGIKENILRSIVGQRCLTKFTDLSLFLPDNYVTVAGTAVTPTVPLSSLDCIPTHCESVVKEMCIRLNDVRTIRSILTTLIETAVETVGEPSCVPDIVNIVSCSSETPQSTSSMTPQNEENFRPASMNSVDGSKTIDKESMTKAIKDLEEVEEGLCKIMAYRGNFIVKELLHLLLPLNLLSFNTRKRLQPVLNVTKRTMSTLASCLYHDCFTMVLRHFWLAIVKDFENEKENLKFLNGLAKDQAHILLDGLSYFIELFRAEGDAISLVFISNSIESVSQSLHLYILTTSSLIEMYRGTETRNDSTLEDIRERTTYRWQRNPSDNLIGKLRIELHSEQRHFSGSRFVECVAEQIRYEGNNALGICAVPNSRDEISAVNLGQYLLDNGVIRYVGKVIPKFSEQHSHEDDLDEELRSYVQSGSILFVPGKKVPRAIFNEIPAFDTDVEPSFDPVNSSGSVSNILDDTEGECSWFLNSAEVLYKFELSDVEESYQTTTPYLNTAERENQRQGEITTVLFTRRNIDQEAKEFLSTLQDNELLQELYQEYALHQNSLSNCCTPRLTPA